MNTQEIIARYIAMRDYLAQRQEAFDAEIKPYKEGMDALAGMVQLELNQRGEESVKTEAGTAYLSKTMTVKVKDRHALFDFIRESDEFDLLTAAVAKDAVQQYMDEHQGAMPPGVEAAYFTRCNFRRA